MATKKITDLTELTVVPDNTDMFPVEDVSVPATKKISFNTLYTAIVSILGPGLIALFAPIAAAVSGGNSHAHTNGCGAQIDHTTCSNIGSNTHAAIDTFIASKAAASGLASLDASSQVVQAPALHAAIHAAGGRDALTPAAIGALGLDVSAEIVISAAATLTAANLGHMHRCAGTAADYTVILPPVSGNAGSLVGIRIDNAFTKFVTLKGSGNDLIDGVNLRGLWAGELAILLCDGTTWVKIWGISRPMQAKITATAIQSIPNATYTTLRMDAITFDIGGLADLANSRIVARRAGYYEVMANASTSFDSFANLYIVGAFTMASPRSPGAGGSMPSLSGVGTIQAGSTLSIQLFHNYGSSGSTYSQPYPSLYVKELLAW